jgi:hypothetical protein
MAFRTHLPENKRHESAGSTQRTHGAAQARPLLTGSSSFPAQMPPGGSNFQEVAF